MEPVTKQERSGAPDDLFIITEAWLRCHANGPAGWNKAQLKAIGVAWPLVKGWLNRTVGRAISQEQRQAFERLRHAAEPEQLPEPPKCWRCGEPFPRYIDFEGEPHCPSCFVAAEQDRLRDMAQKEGVT